MFGLYEVLERLREEFPHVIWESCAGGGGRADLGMLRWTDQVWTSDNTEAADRLPIQHGYSHAYAARFKRAGANTRFVVGGIINPRREPCR